MHHQIKRAFVAVKRGTLLAIFCATGSSGWAQQMLFVGCANSSTTAVMDVSGTPLYKITNLWRSVVGVEVDPVNQHVYMGGGNYHTVVRANYDGTGLTQINTGTSTNYAGGKAPFGERLDLALDVAGNRLFITTGGAGQQVCVGNLDGTGNTTVLWDTGHRLNGIEYDPLGDKIYFADLDAGIYVANADGSGSPTLLYAGLNFRQLTLDSAAGVIYWTDWANNAIRAGSMSGGATSTVFSGLAGQPYGIDLDPASGTLYWTECFGGQVYSGNTNGSGKTLIAGVYDTRGLAVTRSGTSAAPEISVLGTNGEAVADGEAPSAAKGTDFGSIVYGISLTNTFAITNSGSGSLTISGVGMSGAGAAGYSVPDMPSVVDAGAVSNFSLVFNPPGAGDWPAAVTITNNSTNTEYVVNVTGTVSKADQAITDFLPTNGSEFVTTDAVGLSASASSGLPVSFAVGSGPGSISGGTNLTFTGAGSVSLVASQAGDANWNAAPDVTNTFNVTEALMAVLGTNGAEIVNGEAASTAKGTDFGTVNVGLAVTNSLAITNAGDAELTISGWTTNGTGADAFSILDMPSAVSASSAVQFRVVFNPPFVGTFTGTVSIVNNSTNSPFLLNLRGSAYSLSTNIGPYAGGNTITITNGDFGTITNVLVGGVNATIQDSGANWVTITLPATGSAGVKDIVIQTSDNGDITLAGAYTYNSAGQIGWTEYGPNVWTNLGSGMNNNVYALAHDGTNLYAGGNFTTADGMTVNNVAKWDPASGTWTNLGSGMNSEVRALEYDGTNLYVGGLFTTAGGMAANYVAKWDPASGTWTNLGSGMNSNVRALSHDGISLYAGGWFTTAGGVAANYVAKWDPASEVWTNFGSGMDNGVFALANDGTNLHAGGAFTTAGGVAAIRVAKWDPASGTWTNLGSGMNLWVYALAHDGTNLYAGGYFTTAGGVSVNYVAKWDPASGTWTNLGSGMNDWVLALAHDGTNLYAGGEFTTAGGVAANFVAKWDPASGTWTNLGSGMNENVYALTHDGPNLYAGGNFTTAGGVAANKVAKWGPTYIEISGVEPSSGSTTGGYQVVISGLDLGDGSDITNVTLCGVSVASIQSQSSTQVVVVAGAGGPGIGDVRVFSTSFGETVKSNAFTYLMPQFLLLGTNGMEIVNGEAASAAKGMDFGILPWGQALTNQFAITNAGDAELTISGWTTNGTGADAFSILDMPSVVSASSAVQFRAVFSPATAGAFTCTVSIVNDSTNTPYLLNLRGSAYSLSTNIGPYAGGNMITITNGDFGTITNVTVGGVNATIQGSGASWVTITLPAAGSAGVKDIVIQTSDNGDITLAGAYTYNAAGEIIAIYYDTNQWTEVAGLPEERRDLAAGVLDGALYALGGWDGTTPYTNMWRYDGTTWTEVTGLSTARYGLAAGVLNGSLYAIGGVDSAVRTNVYRYDGTNWTEVAGLPLARRDLAAGVLNGALYALGGFSGTYRTNMWRYDGTNWTQVAGLPAARRDLAAGVLDGALYALGGYDGSYQTNVWRYDGTNWAEVASLPEARRNLAADVWNGALYAIGGRDGAVQTNVYRYDGTNWTEVAGLLARRDELAAGMLDDVLYAIGGRFGSARTNVYRYPGRLDLGVNPSSGSYTGGYTVVLTGTDLGDGADVTNVTLCGVSVTSIDSQSATQVIVTAGPSAAGELGDVRVFSTSFGETVKSNAFTYLMPQFIFLGTNGAVIANGAAASTEAGTDYGALIVGLAVTNTFGITNSGNADLIISGVTSSGTGSASFELVDPIAVTFPVTNPAGNLAYLQVAFRPQSGGSQPAEFTVYHNGTNSPFVVNLAGFGLGGGIALETNELAFSGTYGGASPADQYLLVSNVGVSGFTYTNVVTYSAGASGWLAVGPAAGTVALAGSANLTNAVDIAGVNAGTYYATNAMIAAEATNSPQVYVVTLTVNKADQAITDFLPTNGSAFVTTDAVGLAASASSGLPVSFATNGGPAVIAGGTNLSFTGTGSVSIVASQAGDANWNPAPDVTNTFIVTEVPTVLMAVLGTNGAEVASGEAASAAKGTDFGAVGWGRAVTNVLAVTNNGTALLSITAVTTNGDGAAEFEVRDLPFDVSPGAASNFAVVFTPVLGLSTAVVSLANTSTNDPFELRLAGSGFAYTTTVVTAYGVANPGTTSTAYGVSLDEWIEGSPVEAGGTQIVCAAATVAGNDYTQVTPTNISLTVTNHSLVTWQWTTNVQFTVSAGPNGSVTGDPSGWYPLGGSVTVTAVPDVTYYFDSWTGDVPAGQTNQNPLALTMDRVRSITANFSTNPPSIGTHYVVLNNPGAAYPYTSWATAASNIQDAIDAAAPGETVLVSNGVYNTGGRAGSVSNRVIIAEGVTLESVGGPSVTFIVGEGPCGENAVRCVKMGTNSALIGFTLTNGHTWVTGTASLVRSGGGVWCDTGAVVSNCVITGNRAQYYGGGAYRGTLLDCVFTANECTNYGGGAYRSTVVGGVFSNNASADDGGGAHGGTLAGCLFTGNRAKDKGGGVCSASLTNCVFTDNYCANNGGGAANSRLDTCTLSGNEAFDVGGGAYGGTLTNCVLEGNSAGYAGGGAAYSTLLALCTVSNNVAGQYGGGAHQSTLRYCAVVDNVSSNYGGGTSDSTLTGCRVTGNDGGWGGGTYQGTVYSSTNDGNTAQIGGGAFQSSMYSCLLTNNQAVTGGGAYGGSLRNCLLAGNQATSGGGAYDSILRWCRLTDNVADGRGGGANLGTLYNCLLTGNLAGTGGATRASTLYNCTLAANTAASGAGASYGTLINCIVYDNLVGENLTNCTAQFTCSTPLPAGTNNIVGPPAFAGGGDYHLVFGSPCIDTGTNLSPSVTNDLDHVMRPLDGDYSGTAEYDMGCYEAGGETNLPFVAITDPPADTTVSWTTETYNVEGVYNVAVVPPLIVTYTNDQTNGTILLDMATPWNVNIDLAFGTNLIVVVGTNATGEAATDSVYIVRNGYGTPFVDITNVNEEVGYPVTTITIGGTNNGHVVGQMDWTNALTGDAGTFAAVSPWSIADIPLEVGVNTITVRGTNIAGAAASDTVEITRSTIDPGPSPIHYVALEGGHLWPYTNWFTAATNIQDAVNTADEGDLVLVTNGLYYLPQTVEIERGMTVQGFNGWSNTVVDAQSNGPCFYLGASNIVLDGFTITNGYYDYGGGVIVESPPPVTVQNCLITGNRADYVGGGVASEWSLTILNCRIIGNEVMDVNGIGGGVAAEELFMEDCLVVGNLATNGSGVGGGVAIITTGFVQRCVISSNRAAAGGGAYVVFGGVFSNCQIIGNQAITNGSEFGGFGGGVLAVELDVEDSLVDGNTAFHGGGLLVISGRVDRCTISGNIAEFGGGLVSGFFGEMQLGGVVARDCTIGGNQAISTNIEDILGGGAGAMLFGGSLQNCTITGNVSASIAGGVWCAFSNSLVENCTIADNEAEGEGAGGILVFEGGTVRNCLITRNVGASGGGMVCIMMSEATGLVENCTIAGNVATNYGGGLLIGGGVCRNTIIYSNEAPSNANWYVMFDGVFESCCTTPTNGLTNATNCIDADPQFVDAPAGNYRLQATSPCLNTGTNQDWMAGAFDLDGNPRVMGPSVDMGAYEYMPVIIALAGEHGLISPSGAVAVVWGSNQAFLVTADVYYHIGELLTNGAPDAAATNLQTYTSTWENVVADGTLYASFDENLAPLGTPEWWLAYYDLTNGGFTFAEAETNNNDGDPHNNRQEQIANTDPTDSNDFLYIRAAWGHAAGDWVYWPSELDRLYGVDGLSNLLGGSSWFEVTNDLEGTGGWLSITNLPGLDPVYYRVKVRLNDLP